MGIGQEYIKASKYPKFSLTGEYSFFRHGKFLGVPGVEKGMDNAFGGGLSIETGVYKYLNAGASFSSTIGKVKTQSEPLHFRFTLFAKPLISIKDRVTFFSRIGGGLSVMGLNPLMHFSKKGSMAVKERLVSTYGLNEQNTSPYSLLNPGVNAMATIGAEVFPFSRVGIALEWGIRTDLYYISSQSILDDVLGADTGGNKPSIKYLSYEMPLTLTVHIIL